MYLIQEVYGSVSRRKLPFDLHGHLQMHALYKHFHAEILYTETLEVMCVLAFMHAVCVF